MSGNYKVKIKDIQNKYKFKIFCASNYDDSEIKKMYEAIYMALPKESSSGTSNTLNDTAKSFMMNKLYATETLQKTTTGKQLLDILSTEPKSNGVTYSQDLKSVIVNFANSGDEFFAIKTNFENPTTKAYTLAFKASGVKNDEIPHYTIYGGSQQHQTLKNGLNVVNIPSGIAVANSRLLFDDANRTQYPITSTITFSEFMLVEGTYTEETMPPYEEYTGEIASPNPDYPQDIHTINGDNKIQVRGKNLFDGELELGILDGDTGQPVANTSYMRAKNFILVDELTEYVIKSLDIEAGLAVYEYKKDFTYNLTTNKVLSNEQAFTTERGTKYIKFRPRTANTDLTSRFMLNKGTTALNYEPYQSNSVILTLGDKEICWIGDYKDKIFKAIKGDEIYDSFSDVEKATLDYGKWYLRKETGKAILDGSSDENWNLWNIDNTNTQRFYTTIVDVRRGSFDNNIVINNYNNMFIWASGDGDSEHQRGSSSGNYADFVLFINRSRLSSVDVAGLRAYLQNNNLIIYYQLKTPTNEKFNDIIQEQLEDIYYNMLSYEGQTNVSQINDDLPFNINSSALKDLSDL